MPYGLDDVTIPVHEGLVLDAPAVRDAAAVHAAVQDAEIRRWLPLPNPYPYEVALQFCTTFADETRRSGAGLIKFLRADGDFVGVIDAKRIDWRAHVCEIGYWSVAGVRGRGYMTAAVRAFSAWLLNDAGFERVELRIGTENAASRRVADKAGFRFEGVALNAGFTDEGRIDLSIYSRLPDGRAGQKAFD